MADEAKTCSFCGADSPDRCKFNGLDMGCDHPSVLAETRAWLDDLMSGRLLQKAKDYADGR